MTKKYSMAKEYKLKIGSNIRKWRNIKSVKQKELAASMGLSETAISNIENDLTNVTLTQLEDISSALDVPVEHLFNDPQETYHTGNNVYTQQPVTYERELFQAVISSLQKKDEQLQAIMQNVLHTMTALVQDEKKFI